MEGGGPAGDIPDRLAHTFGIITTPSYNISLNLSSLFAMIPGSKFLARLRKGRTMSLFETPLALDLTQTEITSTEKMVQAWATKAAELAVKAEKSTEQQPPMPQFPGPWEFFTSGYILGLIIMAVLLRRMQNVIIPSPRRSRRAYRSPLQHTSFWDRFHSFLLPLDFSRTTTRLILHLPSVFYLAKMLTIWVVLVLQTCEVFPSFTSTQKEGRWGSLGAIEQVGRWAMKQEMAQICWSTFCSVCGAFLVEGLVKALDGLGGGGFPLGGVNSLTPFHLVSYAFLLHIYSSPVAHGFHPANTPSRPDKHVVITITIALLQLSIFHILSIFKRLSTHRLIPTTITSVLSLIHFHTTLYFHLTIVPSAQPARPTTTIAQGKRLPSYMAANHSYPLLNYVPNVCETLLLSSIALTVFTNALAQLLVRGRIDRLFSGLGFSNALPTNDDSDSNGFFANLPYEEDFIIVLLRVGISSMEATGLRGWNNEMAPIQRPRVKPNGRRADIGRFLDGQELNFAPPEDTYGRVRMGRVGVGEVEYGTTTSIARTPALTNVNIFDDRTSSKRLDGRPRQTRGFNNDVRSVDLGNSEASRSSHEPWSRGFVVFGQFMIVLWGVFKGLVMLLLDRARGRARHPEGMVERKRGVVRLRTPAAEEDGDVNDDAELREENRRLKEKEVYQRFLRGEDISDDDEEAEDEIQDLSEDEEEDLEVDTYEDREAEAVNLFTDLLRNRSLQMSAAASPSSSDIVGTGEMVLARLIHGGGPSPGPMTRRRWTSLAQGDPGPSGSGSTRRDYDPFDDSVALTRGGRSSIFDVHSDREAEARDKEAGLRHVCVICMLETREIICWPCRCLAMCDSCRETMALNGSASKHRCPCCRQLVEGYSRIYIP